MSDHHDFDILKIGTEIVFAVEHAETLSSAQKISRLEQDLPTLLEVGRTLAVYSNAISASPDHLDQVEIIEEAGLLLERLAQALLPLTTLARRRASLFRLIYWAYVVCISLQHHLKAGNYALELGRLALSQKKPTEVKEWIKRATNTNRKARSGKMQAEIIFLKGQVTSYEEEYLQAQAYFTKALRLFKKQKNFDGIVASLLESGKACFYQNELEQALADLNQAVSVAKQADSDQFLDECHYYQGLVYYQAGDYNSAIICLRQALAQAQQQENQSLRTKIQDQLKKAENKM